jgi:hypothetical protein
VRKQADRTNKSLNTLKRLNISLHSKTNMPAEVYEANV